jgi:hypothetical protein
MYFCLKNVSVGYIDCQTEMSDRDALKMWKPFRFQLRIHKNIRKSAPRIIELTDQPTVFLGYVRAP